MGSGCNGVDNGWVTDVTDVGFPLHRVHYPSVTREAVTRSDPLLTVFLGPGPSRLPGGFVP